MSKILHRAASAFATARAEHAAVADEMAADNLRRLTWLAPVMVGIGLLHVLTFQAPGPGDLPHVQAWKHALLGLHQGMVVLSVLLGATALWLRRRGNASGLASRACVALAFAAALGFVAALSAVDQWVTPNITPFVLGCALVGVTFLQRPLTKAAIYLGALGVFAALLAHTQHDPQLLLSNRSNAGSAAVLGWMLAMLSWRKSAQTLVLRRQLEGRQAELEAKQRELQHLATHDGLTGLISRNEIERLCRVELLRAQRHGLPLSLLVIDIDHFKRINDRWGHPLGDAVLVAVADVLRRAVRVSDAVGRMGGEEFLVLMPHGDAAAALRLAEKLRRMLAGVGVPAGHEQVVVTASVGVATAPPGRDVCFDSLYLEADRALYRAKSAGRDRVEIA